MRPLSFLACSLAAVVVLALAPSAGGTSFSLPGCCAACSSGTGAGAGPAPCQAVYWRRISAEASLGETVATVAASGMRSTAPERIRFMFWSNARGFA